MNNFNFSTTGVNIEFSAQYDTELASMYFEDEFEVIGSERGIATKLFYTAGGEHKFSGSLEDYYVYPEGTNIREVLMQLFQWSGESAADFVDIIDYVAGVNSRKLSLDDINEVAKYVFGSEYLDEWLENVCESTLESIGVHGYCQGDYCKVYYHKEEKVNSGYLENIVYGTPVSGVIEIDNEEYYIDEMLSNNYSWNKGEVLEYMQANIEHSKKDYIMEWLNENLPEYLDYL